MDKTYQSRVVFSLTPTSGEGFKSVVLCEDSGLTPDLTWTVYDSFGNASDITINQSFNRARVSGVAAVMTTPTSISLNFEDDPQDAISLGAAEPYNFNMQIPFIQTFRFTRPINRIRAIHGGGAPSTDVCIELWNE
jgi:hypothetical protein